MALRRIDNPPNPYQSGYADWDDAPPAKLEIYEERARSIISENDSPDVGFRFGVNPYRGCAHGCIYCYARPTHEYLDWGAGTDFERKIVAKVNAPELLAAALAKRTWTRSVIAFSGVTDCYQPIEATYRLTRRCLEACVARANPVSIITKGALVQRDADVLAELRARANVFVWISVSSASDEIARKIDPFATSISRRFAAMRTLREQGVPVGVALAPIIPGLTDREVPRVLERAHDAGAEAAFLTLLRLPKSVKDVFAARLREVLPEAEERVWAGIREARGGRTNDARPISRMRGEGARWQMVEDIFRVTCARLGIRTSRTGDIGADLGEGARTSSEEVTATGATPKRQLPLAFE